jgi:myo-inositol-1(or 4)-monophosphatase
MDLQAVRTQVEQIAREAGRVALSFWSQSLTEMTKKDIYDIVTEGDKASEAVIVAALRELFPAHHIVGEEGGGQGAPAEGAEYFWFVDPVDGTVNFAHKIPLFAVSIALADAQHQPLVGVVYNPAHDEMFSAARGFGAALNGQPIHVTALTRLDQAVLATGFAPSNPAARENLARLPRFLGQVRDMRRLGSVALELSYVASGRLDGVWEPNLSPWDVMAGLLCVQEAGGRISDYSGGTAQLFNAREVLATNGGIHDAVLSILNEA